MLQRSSRQAAVVRNTNGLPGSENGGVSRTQNNSRRGSSNHARWALSTVKRPMTYLSTTHSCGVLRSMGFSPQAQLPPSSPRENLGSPTRRGKDACRPCHSKRRPSWLTKTTRWDGFVQGTAHLCFKMVGSSARLRHTKCICKIKMEKYASKRQRQEHSCPQSRPLDQRNPYFDPD